MSLEDRLGLFVCFFYDGKALDLCKKQRQYSNPVVAVASQAGVFFQVISSVENVPCSWITVGYIWCSDMESNKKYFLEGLQVKREDSFFVLLILLYFFFLISSGLFVS